MTARAHIKELITPGDRFPAPTKPFNPGDLTARGITIFFTSGAVDFLPPEGTNDRRFMVVEAPKPKRRAYTGCPIQVDGPYYTRSKTRPLRPLASALLVALVAAVLRGG